MAAMPAPLPLLIDAAPHTCVAWWHGPAPAPGEHGWLGEDAPPLAAVLASSWGEEDLSAYDGLRALAGALAGAGIGVVRFEWPDTGDSSAATGAASPADALAAFDAAATQARALSGCDRLAFVGLRLGALLAARAAASRDDVDALVALLPVASGHAFTSAQRLLDAGAAQPVRAPAPGAFFDPADLPVALGGFTQSVRGLEAMAAMKWPAEAPACLRDVLLMTMPQAPAIDAVAAFAGACVRVSAWSHAGLATALRVAHEAIAEIVRWLQARAVEVAQRREARTPHDADAVTARLEAATGVVLALAAAGARPWMRLRWHGVAVRERLVRLGDPHDREPPLLAAVLSEADRGPDSNTAHTPRRGIVLLPARRERRVGPHRLWVPWARERAARGDVVLRLDLPGIGDSEPHAPAGHERADPRDADAIARAVGWLRREHGVGAVSVIGLCHGAWQAWQAVLGGVDVQQVVIVNPSMPSDPRAGEPARRLTLRGLPRALAARARHALRRPLRDDLARVAARGVALDVVFSRREPGLARWRQEAGGRGARLARDGRVTLCELAHAGPTFAGTAARAALHACLDELLPPPSRASVAPAVAAAARLPEIVR